jgi:hypothetical protein
MSIDLDKIEFKLYYLNKSMYNSPIHSFSCDLRKINFQKDRHLLLTFVLMSISKDNSKI